MHVSFRAKIANGLVQYLKITNKSLIFLFPIDFLIREI